MSDDYIGKILEESIKVFIPRIGNILSRMGSRVRVGFRAADAAKNYARRYAERYSRVKVLGMTEPLNLTEFYTYTRAIRPTKRNSFVSPKDLEDYYKRREQRTLFHADGEIEDGMVLANNHNRLAILGQPGGGKSTFLKYVGLQALLPESQYKHSVIPVFVELRVFKDRPVDLLQTIEGEFKTAGFPAGFAEEALKDGNLLVLLDAIDEVPPSALEVVLDHIRAFEYEFHDNRFILSCRTACYDSFLDGFTDFELADFDLPQIEYFIERFFTSADNNTREIGVTLWKTLNDPQHCAIMELASTPLLLVYICLLYMESQQLPANRSDLYEEILRILMEKWAAQRHIWRQEAFRGLTSKIEILMLQAIAGPGLTSDRRFFAGKEIVDIFDNYLEQVENAPKGLDGEQLLHTIEQQQGLLVLRARDVYSFCHATIQEYLAARQFIGQDASKEIVKTYFFDKRWREVFLMMSGIGVPGFLECLAGRLGLEATSSEDLLVLLKWLDLHSQPSENKIDACARRAAACYVVRFVLSQLYRLYGHFGLEGYEGHVLSGAVSYSPYRKDPELLYCMLCAPQSIAHLENIRQSMTSIISHSLANRLEHLSPNIIYTASRQMLTSFEELGMFAPTHLDRIRSAIDVLRHHGATIPQNASPLEWKWRLLEQFLGAMLPNLDLAQMHLLARNSEPLQQYLYGVLLILDCKEAALIVTENSWRDSVSGLFSADQRLASLWFG